MEQLFIPNKLKVGYQKRSDTYTKKLAYVIYYDTKGVLRKETSWQGWRDEKIKADDFDNVPTEGFVLNKNAGGGSSSHGWHQRREVCRVWDPRGFEFEIGFENLLFILQESNSMKGKGLEGEFVYAWEGKDLILLPASSDDYKKGQANTKLQGCKVTAKELTEGCSYKTKKGQDLLFIGKRDFFEDGETKGPKFVFLNENPNFGMDEDDDYEEETREDFEGTDKQWEKHLKEQEKWKKEQAEELAKPHYVALAGITSLAVCNNTTPVSNYAEIAEAFYKSKKGSRPVALELNPVKVKIPKPDDYLDSTTYFIKKGEGTFEEIQIDVETDWKGGKDIVKGYRIEKQNDIVLSPTGIKSNWHSGNPSKLHSKEAILEMQFNDLIVTLESGSKMPLSEYQKYEY